MSLLYLASLFSLGFGPWSRQLGRFNNYVSSFDIVLADGSLMSVTTPEEGVSSKLNDDIWHAVLGGASGSFGVIGRMFNFPFGLLAFSILNILFLR